MKTMKDSLENFGGGEVEGIVKEDPCRVLPHERLPLSWHVLNALLAIVRAWFLYFLSGLLMGLVFLVFPGAMAYLSFKLFLVGFGSLVVLFAIFKGSVRAESKALLNYKKKFGSDEN